MVNLAPTFDHNIIQRNFFMELMNQPFTGQLGDRLIELLESPDYHTLKIVVAFAKNSGVLRVKDSLEKFRSRGGKVNVYVGVDLGVTSYEALTALLLCTDTLNIVHSENGQTFHSKIYQFLGEEKNLIIVGSHNLTGGGLWTNFESSLFISVNSSIAEEIEILRAQDDYILKLTSLKDSFKPIESKDDVDKLLQNGYIFKEVSQQVRLAKEARTHGNQDRLFGNGAPAVLPRVDMPTKETATAAPKVSTEIAPFHPHSESKTIWFESRRMTGGSRNILDLSMKSLVERGEITGTTFDIGEARFINGGVKFFGLDPTDTSQSKDITLNFEGVDYTSNTILFPTGESANGTWRLQIKGESSSNIKITETFKDLNAAEGVRNDDKGEPLLYLQFKIITFTKVRNDYYSMSVHPVRELKSFCEASRILARNGQSHQARQLGLL